MQPEDILPIFQRWIQEHTIEGMLIDVIDYKHVPDGPGIVLIADEFDLAYDLADGEIGLYYMCASASCPIRWSGLCASSSATRWRPRAPWKRKRQGTSVIDFNSAKISFLDRIHYRNEPEIFETVRGSLTETLSEIMGANVLISRMYDDPRAIFALRCTFECCQFRH